VRLCLNKQSPNSRAFLRDLNGTQLANQAAEASSDPDVREFAVHELPTLTQHVDEARRIQAASGRLRRDQLADLCGEAGVARNTGSIVQREWSAPQR
jgi:hypothetical protein